MRLRLALGAALHEIELNRKGDTVTGTVDGKAFSAHVTRSDASTFDVEIDGTHHRVQVPDAALARIDGRDYTYGVWGFDATHGAAGGPGADGKIRAPMPGAITKLLVRKGEQVKAGAPLAILEAMKMQNEIRAPVAGTVTKLSAKVGDTVTPADVIVELEVAS